jgi:hypothetical protein
MKRLFALSTLITVSIISNAQADRWQQRIKYNIEVQMDVQKNQFKGKERMEYTNNSPDSLSKLFIHLYWNAFQPNSSMDVRSIELGKQRLDTPSKRSDGLDWDPRVKDRISKLQPTEIGYQKVFQVLVNGRKQSIKEHETILEVVLDKPIAPKSKSIIEVDFEAQVPKQVRRSGRDNAEGVQYSMSQWYPKMVEYDYQGWNANPYIAREFYGVWGDYDVKITIPKQYIIGGTGILQNANTIGHGYEDKKQPLQRQKTANFTWHFKGENIHDFVWAADTAYKHLSKKIRNNLTIHAFYKNKDAQADSAWNNVLYAAEKVIPFIEKNYGVYPYPQYSFIQGGDGGMEYAMATLLKGPSLGTVFHEWMHTWYQHILGTNESLYAWMDEGFTSYTENEVMHFYNSNFALQSPYLSNFSKQNLQKEIEKDMAKLPYLQFGEYAAYFRLAKSGFEEPLTTHADHFNTNYASTNAAYVKGALCLSQLKYIIGDSLFVKTLLSYYNTWKFKHPNPNDFFRVAEKESGVSLQWFKEYWINSTKTIDYKLGNVETDSITGKPIITISRIGKMPMPIDVEITYKDGTKDLFNIPLNLMYGNKPINKANTTILPEWKWTHPNYSFSINRKVIDIKKIEIDPQQLMADVNKVNNKFEVPN